MEWFKHSTGNKKISPKLRTTVAFRDKGFCQICGKVAHFCKWNGSYWNFYEIITYLHDEYHISFDIDHIKPRCQGGKTTLDNLQLLCQHCNRVKGNKEKRNAMV